MRTRPLLAIALALLAVAAMPAIALAQDGLDVLGGGQQEQGPYATVDLLVAATTVKPGESIPVGVRFKLKDGWHVYWQNPGDAGQPPTFAWNLPGGGAARMMRGGEWTATQPEFPTPIGFEFGGIGGFGYEGEIVFPATLVVPASATPGQGAEVSVVVEYLICDDQRCVPESAIATANLTVAMAAEPDAEAAAAIEAAVASVPRPAASSSTGLAVREATAEKLVVTLPADATNVGFFPMPVPTAEIDAAFGGAHGHSATHYTFQITSRPFGDAGPTPAYDAVVGYTTADDQRRGAIVSIPAAGE